MEPFDVRSVGDHLDQLIMLGKDTLDFLALFKDELGNTGGHAAFITDTAKDRGQVLEGRLFKTGMKTAFGIAKCNALTGHGMPPS
ncbi:hypothetical protein SPHV1_800023 [Novosphingobium sp. KN65.2]|nr:hypothetical protein SPHV1_800023 [Novosphingobium sp. KN65.2]